MPNFTALMRQIAKTPGEPPDASPTDIVRRIYLAKLHEKINKRNVIAYYSGWLSKPKIEGTEINDEDKNGFMLCVHKMEKSKGLDLILHTPGGDGAATESLIFYLREMFGNDIRAVIPQIAMSAGTIIACSCKSILMGKHSNIGPVDPQFGGIPAIGVLSELARAWEEIKEDQRASLLWNPILGRLTPSFVQQCEWSIGKDLIGKALREGMFNGEAGQEEKMEKIIKWLSDLSDNKTHSRHFHYKECQENGLKIEMLEDGDAELQDLVLTVHHCFMLSLMNSHSYKIIENHLGRAMVKQIAPQFMLQMPPGLSAAAALGSPT
jgi:ATP-dependent protease ClpP protease subunit